MTELLLRVSNLSVSFHRQVVLSDVSFELRKNETLAIIGPNGAGKSTLLRALLGLIPYEGTVTWQKGVKIGYVPQRFSVERDLPLTTAEFFALKGEGIHRKEIETAFSVMRLPNGTQGKRGAVDHILKRKLGVLSGGELQRVLVAWALLDRPDILLFDEPTSGIDASGEITIYSLLRRLQEQEHFAIVLISHELQVVYKYASNVLCLNKETVCFGPPKEVFDKESLTRLFGTDVGFYQHHSQGNSYHGK